VIVPGFDGQWITPQQHELLGDSGSSVIMLTQPSTSKLVLGYDFSGGDSVVTVTGSGVSNVTDSSGRSNAGVQATDSRRYAYGTATINGRLAADNNSNSTACINIPATVTGWTNNGQPPFHFLVLFSANAWAVTNLFGFQNNGGALRSGFRLGTTGGTRVEGRVPTVGPGNNTIQSNQTALATGTTYLAELAVDSGGAASLIVNEGTATTSTSASSSESLSLRFVGSASASSNVKYGAVYVFNDKLDSTEIAAWRAFLKQRWGYV
jgi:hypothetical protein